MKGLKISCQKHKIGSLTLSSRHKINYIKTCSFLHANFSEAMKVVENLLRKVMANHLIIGKTYFVGTHWNCAYEIFFIQPDKLVGCNTEYIKNRCFPKPDKI